jgi:uncharacterized protein
MDTNESHGGAGSAGANPPVGGVPVGPTKDEKMWAMFCHLAALSGFVVPIPFAGIIGPLIIWSLKKDEFPLVADQGKEAMNFQITVAILFVLFLLLLFVCIGAFLLTALGIFNLVFVIIAALKANEGMQYRYPMSIRFIK